jgi:hypothetical protein
LLLLTPQSIKAVAREDKLVAQLLLSDIPPAAACLIYQRLSKSSRRALLLSSKEVSRLLQKQAVACSSSQLRAVASSRVQ